MPIGPKEWEDAEQSMPAIQAAVEFLDDEYPVAYNANEILQHIGMNDPHQMAIDQLMSDMMLLEAIGWVESRQIEYDSGMKSAYYRATGE